MIAFLRHLFRNWRFGEISRAEAIRALNGPETIVVTTTTTTTEVRT